MTLWPESFVEEHNAEAEAVWEAFRSGHPIRPPVFLGASTQYFFFHETLNPGGRLSIETYSTDARTMLDHQLKWLAWRCQHIAPYCDDPIGLPDEFLVKVDLGTFDDAAYFGAPVVFVEGQVPDTKPILTGDRKNALFDVGLPHPLKGGWIEKAHQIYSEMMEIIAKQPTYLDRPIRVDAFGHYTAGIFTTAVSLRGVDIFTDIYDDPDYFHQLMTYITQGTIQRIQAHREFFELPQKDPLLFFADDAIQLISLAVMKKHVLPYYSLLKSSLTDSETVKIHLCGDATRHFKTLRDEIGAYEFDTGFPVDFSWLRQELGSNVTVWGGPNVMLLNKGTPQEVRQETLCILNSGICEGGKFVLREANNLPPYTPLENLKSMYETAREWAKIPNRDPESQ
jgi:hypothetical protein